MDWEQIIVWTFITAFLVVMSGAIIMVWFEEITAPFKKLYKKIFQPKSKYAVGQKVRVNRDLEWNKQYSGRRVYQSMMNYLGRVVVIKNSWYDEEDKVWQYEIEEDYGEDTWTEEMLESNTYTPDQAFEALLHGHISDEEYETIMKRRRRG